MGFTVTTIVIAVLAGVGAYFSWNENRLVSLACGVVCAIASAIATIAAFVWAVAVVFKLLPIILLVIAIWLIYRAVAKRRGESRQATYQP